MKNSPNEAISHYLVFSVDSKIYYFTSGRFLYRKDLGIEEVEDFSAATSPIRSYTDQEY